MPSPFPHTRLEGLDFLRGSAALTVFAGHFYILTQSKAAISDLHTVFRVFFEHGAIGVDLFYVLSGFFIGTAIMKNSFEPRDFCVRRVRRIIPAYYFSMLIIVTLVIPYFLVSYDGLKHLILHLFFIHNLFPSSHGSINGVYWTLGVELQFYVLLLVLAGTIRKNGRGQWILLLSFFIISLIWRTVAFYFFVGDNRFYFSTQLPGSLDRFATGLIIARMALDNSVKYRAIISSSVAKLGVIAMPLAIAYALYLMERWSGWDLLYGHVLFGSFISVAFGLLILSVISASRSNIVQQAFQLCGLSYLGKISYSFYLYHLPVILAFKPIITSYIAGTFSQLLIIFISVMAIASMSYHLIEARWHKAR